jgi:hypothetical protein
MDITMCKGTNCPLRLECFRYRAIHDSQWQSMFITIPYNKETQKCKHFWEITNEPVEKI